MRAISYAVARVASRLPSRTQKLAACESAYEKLQKKLPVVWPLEVVNL